MLELNLDLDEIQKSNLSPDGFCPTNEDITEITEVHREINGQIRASIQNFESKTFLGVWFEMRRQPNSTKEYFFK